MTEGLSVFKRLLWRHRDRLRGAGFQLRVEMKGEGRIVTWTWS